MRLANIQNFLRRHGVSFRYLEENGCGSIEFLHRGLNYYIWEYPASEPGAQSNVRCAGRKTSVKTTKMPYWPFCNLVDSFSNIQRKSQVKTALIELYSVSISRLFYVLNFHRETKRINYLLFYE